MQELADKSSDAAASGVVAAGDHAERATPRCLHCAEQLVLDDLWGWVHDNGEYLCRDRESGELLCQPATLI
ncbi:hypothetical protein [Actinoplanes sp. NPDC026619]|uniref:hypothetical protein n=1 Tax=Actinoplanes sp. NPDC026619 TaxID=3155798 RepID=UPI0033DC7CD5